jgi:hypothetical protein
MLDDPIRVTTNFHGTVLSWPGAEISDVIWLRCILAYLRARGVVDWVGVGGSGGHMSPEYFDYLPIPNFPTRTRKRIAELYHSPASEVATPPSLATFVGYHRARNAKLGIWQLATEMKALQMELSSIQEKIIRGISVDIPLPDEGSPPAETAAKLSSRTGLTLFA